MKLKAGIILMVLGTVLMLTALSLLLFNRIEDNNAGEQSEVLLQGVIDEIEKSEQSETIIPDSYVSHENEVMTVVEIDGYSYVGYVSVPILSLELPVMSECNYSLMKVAPCLYSGSVMSDNLVIAAHNYGRHFGNVLSLVSGDAVFFTDMEGKTTTYEVACIEILQPEQVSEMVESEWDLTLFTCTYSGSERVAVRCMRD